MKTTKFIKSFFLFIFLISAMPLFASHLEGGEITWTCNGSGEYIFKVKLYRDCNGISAPYNLTLTTDAPGLSGGILCNQVSCTDLSPTGPGCPTCSTPNGLASAVLECVYESAPVVISGIPPANGWYFAYIECCRNAAITNLSNTASGYFILRAIMYSFNGLDANPCFDSSPQFAESPTMSACSGDNINYSHAAFDPELDSLTYEWALPLDGSSYPSNGYPFAAGYTYQSPTPGTSLNPLNVPATIDANSGLISFTSYTTGAFVTVTKVTSYKCGVKTAEVYREIQFVVNTCSIGTGAFNTSPDVVGGLNVEDVYVLAGDTVFRGVGATDYEFLSPSNGSVPQNITLTAVGPHFGLNDTSFSTGCLIPPCAVMASPTPITLTSAISSSFTFPTACAHAGLSNGCLQHQRCFSFLFKFKDDFCPTNGVANKILNVYVTGPEIVASGNDLLISYPGASYQWCLNGVPIPGAIDSIYTPVASGIYTVLATSGSGCSMISNPVNRSVASVYALPGQERSVYVYPNPISSSRTLNVQLKDVLIGQSVLFIYDNTGRRLKSINAHLNTTADMLVIDISDLAAGHYTLSFTDKLGELTKSFVVE